MRIRESLCKCGLFYSISFIHATYTAHTARCWFFSIPHCNAHLFATFVTNMYSISFFLFFSFFFSSIAMLCVTIRLRNEHKHTHSYTHTYTSVRLSVFLCARMLLLHTYLYICIFICVDPIYKGKQNETCTQVNVN